jgi:hypothetical protein
MMIKKHFAILFLIAAGLFGGLQRSTACTNVLVTRGASADGSTFIT